MAGFEFDLPDDFLGEILDTDFGEIAQKCLAEAAPILEEDMKRQAKASVSHPGESEMVESIKARRPGKSKGGGYHVFVGPSGYSSHTFSREGKEGTRKYPVSNALKAIWLEYGIQHPSHHQPARPFVRASVNASKDKVLQKMQEVYNRKVGGS